MSLAHGAKIRQPEPSRSNHQQPGMSSARTTLLPVQGWPRKRVLELVTLREARACPAPQPLPNFSAESPAQRPIQRKTPIWGLMGATA